MAFGPITSSFTVERDFKFAFSGQILVNPTLHFREGTQWNVLFWLVCVPNEIPVMPKIIFQRLYNILKNGIYDIIRYYV